MIENLDGISPQMRRIHISDLTSTPSPEDISKDKKFISPFAKKVALEKSLEIKNAVFTDLFFDQNNIVYVHVDKKSKSLMLDKKKSVHQLKF